MLYRKTLQNQHHRTIPAAVGARGVRRQWAEGEETGTVRLQAVTAEGIGRTRQAVGAGSNFVPSEHLSRKAVSR